MPSERVSHPYTKSQPLGSAGAAHAFRVDSGEARLLLFFGPAGVERFFLDGGKPARFRGLPPAGEVFIDKEAPKEIGGRYSQDFVGPPLPLKG